MSVPEETFVVEYPCDLYCRVEICLTGVHTKFTIRQARVAAEVEHRRRHEPPPAGLPVFDRLAAEFRDSAGR